MNRRFVRAISELEEIKSDRQAQIPGILGFVLNGQNTVEVPTRLGFVYVRLRNNSSEVIQAYNDQVAPVYGLPVLVVRDEVDTSKYRILGRDVGVYQNWGSSSSYLPKHGHTHSFIPEEGGGGDVVWVYGKQMMPLAPYPNGVTGSSNVTIKPASYYQNGVWHYAGGTGSPSFLPYRPTDNTAKMVLLYLDVDGNPQIRDTVTTFNAAYTGTAQIISYVPPVLDNYHIPVAGVRLLSGTSSILWDNIYDLRPWIVGDGFLPTGTYTPPAQLVTGTGVIGFFMGGELTATDIRVNNLAPKAGTIENITASVWGSPTGSNIIVDIYKNGGTLFPTNPTNRPTIIPGTLYDLYSFPDTTTFLENDVFTATVIQIGSSGSGSDLQVQVRYKYP
jgi:hypothetical protein